MAKLISEILKVSEPAFTHEIHRLEILAGYPKVDIRLVSELAAGWKSLAAEIGLDESDTNAEELYFGLQRKAHEQNELLSNKLEISKNDSVEKVIKACVKHVESRLEKHPVWVLKSSVVRSQLKANVPKKTLKTLGLRSIGSAIKSEPISELVVFARMVESKTWLEAYIAQANKIQNTDFNRKPIEISIVDSRRSERMQKAGYSLNNLIYKDEETGGIIIVTPRRRFDCDVLFFVDALIRESNSVRRWSAFAKYLSVRTDFQNWLSILRSRSLDQAAMDIFSFGWSPVHHLLDSLARENSNPPFEPQLDHDDVRYLNHKPGPLGRHQYILFKSPDGMIVSCNISDVIFNAATKASVDKATIVHARRDLYNELFSRYLRHDPILEDFIKRQA